MAEKAKILNTGYIREQNTSEIMRCVRKYGPISRSEERRVGEECRL